MSKTAFRPIRVAVFGSYYQGKAVIEKLLELQQQYPDALCLVGVATDDPSSPRVSPQKRIWRFAAPEEYDMIPKLAAENNIPVWTGSIKETSFYQQFAEDWRPDVCYMATFGQKIPAPVFDQPRLGFYNFHPAVDRAWPSYTGGDPFGGMIAAKEPFCSVAMHEVDEEFDHGPLLAFSEPVLIKTDDTILSMYKKTSATTADMVQWHLGEMKITSPVHNYKPRHLPLPMFAATK